MIQLPKIVTARRYALSLDGFPSPSFMNRRGQPEIITIDSPREVRCYSMRLVLDASEPDLPVGQQAEIKLGSHFYLQLCTDLDTEQRSRDAHHQVRAEHLSTLTQQTYETHHKANMALIDTPTKEALLACLEANERAWRTASYAVKNSRYANWGIQWQAEQQQAMAKGQHDACQDMLIAMVTRLNHAGYALHTEYAYSPKEGCGRSAYSPGADHLITKTTLHRGNFRREPHDALCKPRRKFNALAPLHDTPLVSCVRCLSLLISMYCEKNMQIG